MMKNKFLSCMGAIFLASAMMGAVFGNKSHFLSDGDDHNIRNEVNPESSEHIALLEIRSDQTTYKRAIPIVVEYELKNTSQTHSLMLQHPYGLIENLSLAIRYRGEPVPMTKYGVETLSARHPSSSRWLGPGERYSGYIVLNSLFDMTLEGEYHISLSVPVCAMSKSRTGRQMSRTIRSAPILITVTGEYVPNLSCQTPEAPYPKNAPPSIDFHNR